MPQRRTGSADQDAPDPSTIGIGDLARRTGLTQPAIRAWEARFGFPTPSRTDGGRRRYEVAEVERVQQVVALRDSGTRLAQAIARVRTETEEGRALSVYAELRRLHPHLDSRMLRRNVLVAVSHAIEDETMARAASPVVFGAFQQERFFRHAQARWDEIARTASACVVFADFAAPSLRPGTPQEIPLEIDAPLLREWAVVVTAPSFAVVLTAWEVPGQGGVADADRLFESAFSFDPAAVRTAAEVCAAATRASGVAPPALLRRLDHPPGTATVSTGVDALVVRAFDYLQRR